MLTGARYSTPDLQPSGYHHRKSPVPPNYVPGSLVGDFGEGVAVIGQDAIIGASPMKLPSSRQVSMNSATSPRVTVLQGPISSRPVRI